MEVNYLGQVYGALVALKHMKKKGGTLIQTTSIAANVHPPYIGAYNASKVEEKNCSRFLPFESTQYKDLLTHCGLNSKKKKHL